MELSWGVNVVYCCESDILVCDGLMELFSTFWWSFFGIGSGTPETGALSGSFLSDFFLATLGGGFSLIS